MDPREARVSTRSAPYQEDIEDVAIRYRTDAVYLGRAHYKAAENLDRGRRRIGFPAAVLSGLVGTSIFATITINPALWAKVVAGLVSLVASLLSSMQTFFGYADRSREHRIAGAAYAKLRREFDGFLLRLPTDTNRERSLEYLAQLRSRLSELGDSSPLLPPGVYEAAVAEIRNEARNDRTSVGILMAATMESGPEPNSE